jgi:hypothetical protein
VGNSKAVVSPVLATISNTGGRMADGFVKPIATPGFREGGAVL